MLVQQRCCYLQSYLWGFVNNWYTVKHRQVIPAGWHVPSDAEWKTLEDYLGGYSVAGGILKEAGTAHWLTPNTGATNQYGFTALPGGSRSDDGFICWFVL